MMHFVYECTVERKHKQNPGPGAGLWLYWQSFTPAHTCRMGRQLKVTGWGGKSMEADANLLILAEGSARFKCNYKIGEPYWCQSGQHQWRVDSRSEWRRDVPTWPLKLSFTHTNTTPVYSVPYFLWYFFGPTWKVLVKTWHLPHILP